MIPVRCEADKTTPVPSFACTTQGYGCALTIQLYKYTLHTRTTGKAREFLAPSL